MKFLHTADWHLGKRLHEFSLIEVQKQVLNEIFSIVERERPDALIVAGDVFDTQVPQIGALELWEAAVDTIVGELGVPMVIIPGNHDHADRLTVHAGVARRAGLHFVRSLRHCESPVTIAGVDFFGLPFHKPVHVNSIFKDETPAIGDFDYAAAMKFALERVRRAVRQAATGRPAVLIAHAFVDGAGDEPEGEDAIQVGGAGGIPAGFFEGFSYVALGHIHGARKLGAGEVHYSGSPYPYSFSEAGSNKSLNLVELADDGTVASFERVPLSAQRQLQVIEGLSFSEVLRRARTLEPQERGHFTLVRVSDTDPIENAVARLREWYPNSLLEQPNVVARASLPKLEGNYRTLQPEDAFRQFYRHVFGEDLSELEEVVLMEALSGGGDAAGTSVSGAPEGPQGAGRSEREKARSESVREVAEVAE